MSETRTLGYKASKLEEKIPSLLEGQEKLEQLDLDEYCLECLENNRQRASLWKLEGDVSTGHYRKTIRGHPFTVCRLAFPESGKAIDVYPNGFSKIVSLEKKKVGKHDHLREAWAHKAKKTTHPRRRIYGSKPPPYFKTKDLVDPSSNYLLSLPVYQPMAKQDRLHAGRISQRQEVLNKARTYEERVEAQAKLDKAVSEAEFSELVTKKVSYKRTPAGKKWRQSKTYKKMVENFKTPTYVETHKKLSKYS